MDFPYGTKYLDLVSRNRLLLKTEKKKALNHSLHLIIFYIMLHYYLFRLLPKAFNRPETKLLELKNILITDFYLFLFTTAVVDKLFNIF
jgi:hypothetical protein